MKRWPKKAMKDRWDAHADAYEEGAFTGTMILRIANRFETEMIISALEPKDGELILDAGAGTGRLTIELAEKGVEVVGIDLSSNMLRIAKERVLRLATDKKVHLVHGDIENLPFRDEAFEKIISIRVLKYVPDFDTAVDEIQRTCRSSGKVVVGLSNLTSSYLIENLGNLDMIRLGGVSCPRLFTLNESLKVFREKNLVAVRLEKSFSLPVALCRRLPDCLTSFFTALERILQKILPIQFSRDFFITMIKVPN